jgi:ABC-type dipeptide/oligopeptide/nickel transport system permease component
VDGLINANWSYAWDAFLHVILPAITLAFASLGALTRLVRASMLEVLRQDYITLARSKGLSERVVIFRHALRNALIPALTVAGLLFAGLLGGAVITETVFNWPGVGFDSVRAVLQGDSNFVMLYTLVTALIVVVANLIVDVLYAVVDPRIRY